MNCIQSPIINELSEATIRIQATDVLGVPLASDAFDEILFTLQHTDGTIVNGQEKVSVLDENGGSFVESYVIGDITANRQLVVMSIPLGHSLRDGDIGMIVGLPTSLPPTHVLLPLRSLGPYHLSTPQHSGYTWDSLVASSMRVGIFELDLSSDDNAIIGTVPAGERQTRIATLEWLLDGSLVSTEEIPYEIRSLQGVP